MSSTTKAIIDATVKITKMDIDQLQAAMLDILASNPSVIINALEISIKNTTYRVVLAEGCDNKIGLIKAFRVISGYGLADSKAWCEGATLNGCPAGTFKNGLTMVQAQEIANRINNSINHPDPYNRLWVRVKVIKDSDEYDYSKYVNWSVSQH